VNAEIKAIIMHDLPPIVAVFAMLIAALAVGEPAVGDELVYYALLLMIGVEAACIPGLVEIFWKMQK